MSQIQITTYEQNWVDGLNRGDVSAADEVFAVDCVIHINGSPQPNIGLEVFKQMVNGLLIAFPDLRFTIEDQVIAGDKVTTRWTAEGTNTGPLGEIPPTGRRMRTQGIILDRVEGDKVKERWEIWDQMGMMQQLGII